MRLTGYRKLGERAHELGSHDSQADGDGTPYRRQILQPQPEPLPVERLRADQGPRCQREGVGAGLDPARPRGRTWEGWGHGAPRRESGRVASAAALASVNRGAVR